MCYTLQATPPDSFLQPFFFWVCVQKSATPPLPADFDAFLRSELSQLLGQFRISKMSSLSTRVIISFFLALFCTVYPYRFSLKFP